MKIREIIDINKLSIFLLIFPYLGFNWISLYHSPFFSYVDLLGLLALIFGFDLILKKILLINPKNEKLISSLILIIVLIFFYGNYLVLNIQFVLFEFTESLIRGRTILFFSLAGLIFLQIAILNSKNFIKYLNIFLLIFGSINFLATFNVDQKQNTINNIKNTNKQIVLMEKNNKPVILLISDEYSSPDGLYNLMKDSNIYSFSSSLKNKNWIVRNTAYTNETSTIHSLSSLFNFNLSKDQKYYKFSVFEIGPNKLMKAAIYDSLYQKNIELINFGIFDIGKSEPLSSFYFYPKTFFDQFLYSSSFRKIIDNTGGLRLEGFKNAYYPTDHHNQFILENLVDSLKSINNSRTFTYVHLLMPHSPMKYKSEFKIKSKDRLVNYKNYWDFTNIKLEKLLSELTKDNKYRIILSGDHGFRGDKRINPNQTFMAFYGFDEQDLNSIESVQDLGSLINACYK
jgi:hypothetical protein